MEQRKLTLEQTEQQIPKAAEAATNAAYRRALRRGSVLVYRNGELRRVEAGGKYTVVRRLEPRLRIEKGTKLVMGPKA